MTSHPGTWIRRFHESPSCHVKLVCLPHAGGTASCFHATSEALAPSIEVQSVQYPGRQDRLGEPGAESIESLARCVFDAVREDGPDRPLALVGHGMGATVAFEVTRLLERELRVVPLALFVSSHQAPHLPPGTAFQSASDEDLIAEMRRTQGGALAHAEDTGALRAALPATRGDYRLAETYVAAPGRPLQCPITVCVGEEDRDLTLADARAWAEHTTGPFELKVLRGAGHYTADHESAVINEVSDHLISLVASCRHTRLVTGVDEQSDRG